jgi:hypothetical protein
VKEGCGIVQKYGLNWFVKECFYWIDARDVSYVFLYSIFGKPWLPLYSVNRIISSNPFFVTFAYKFTYWPSQYHVDGKRKRNYDICDIFEALLDLWI